MKKIIFIFFLLLVSLFVIILNSSYFLNKVVQIYAPDFNLTYERISGNIFTGIRVDNLKFARQRISDRIIYTWNPLMLLEKKISIGKIEIVDADIETIESLADLLNIQKRDSTDSKSFDFDIEIENVAISINSFDKESITIEKAVLKADNIRYTNSSDIEFDNLLLNINSNIANLDIKANMHNSNLLVDMINISSIDTKRVEDMIQNHTTQGNKDSASNTIIIKHVTLKDINLSILPRKYKDIDIDIFKIAADYIDIDFAKISQKRQDPVAFKNFFLESKSNIGKIKAMFSLKNKTIEFEDLNLSNIDILALQNLFQNTTNQKNNKKHNKKKSIFIPRYLNIKQLFANSLPLTYDKISLETFDITGSNIVVDLDKSTMTKGRIDSSSSTNLANIRLSAEAAGKYIRARAALKTKKPLFKRYSIPLDAEAIETIKADLNITKEHIKAYISTKTDRSAQKDNNGLYIDIEHLDSYLSYRFDTKKLKLDSRATITTPYAKNMSVSNTLEIEEKVKYQGEINAGSLSGLDAKIINPLKHLKILYKGDEKSIHASMKSQQLKGSFHSNDMKKGRLLLETLESISIDEFVSMPKELKKSKLNANIDFPVNFDKIGELEGKMDISSDLIQIDADIRYNKRLQIDAKTEIPKNSPLRKYIKELKWDALTPVYIDADITEENLALRLKSDAFDIKTDYHPKQHDINGKINIAGLITNIDGNSDKNISLNTKISSADTLKKAIFKLYNLDSFPSIEGTADIDVDIVQMKQVNLRLKTPKLIYKADKKRKYIIDDFGAYIYLKDSSLVVDNYSFGYSKQKFFSTKPSKIILDNNKLAVEHFWINDRLDIVGSYNTKTSKGIIHAKSALFPIRHPYADIDTAIDMEANIDGNHTDIKGTIKLLNGNIKYDISQKTFARDSDIVLVEDIKKSKSSFMKNLTADIQIESKNPLTIKQGSINIKLKPEFGIHKPKDQNTMLLGSVVLPKGGTYFFEDKKFVLDKSYVYFTGDPNKPLVELKVKYHSLNHIITVLISGSPDAPLVQFSSDPPLSKEQILSLILFDTEVKGDAHSSDEMMKMMGGAMAKSALSQLGVKLDHLVLGEGNSIEVGKKLTNKMTIIYINGEVSGVKLKYRHGMRTESVIQMSEESQSYDIIFKDDF